MGGPDVALLRRSDREIRQSNSRKLAVICI